ncbi:Membrane protein [Lysobacter dokdonensis DS-58]|uniref:Membrane protein n=1 Tax=Lysobacter dokdonensis DS-58 TaxID=1300345 RepID=A0A0A2WE50_9GAMM|nr:DUF6766 family protein [Lysobacter dokdonensis]KGQ18486.1 Membrane protein [Lysobacter dokdonensis DS-58]
MAEETRRPTDSFFRRNGLSLVAAALMIGSLVGQLLTGHAVYNEERGELGLAALSFAQYLVSGHALSSTFENWESEFLQMGMFVLLTVVLRQKGSSESRPMRAEDENPRIDPGPTPWPVRKGGLWKSLYGHSLAIAFMALFALSFALHAFGSWERDGVERMARHEASLALGDYVLSSQFWFESFQNWQSEFLAVLSLVLLSIWLRQKDSPQSKPLEAPHSQTGE